MMAADSDPPHGDPVESLVAACLRGRDDGEADVLERLCAEHPQHAQVLRARMARLLQVDLLPRQTPPPVAAETAPQVAGFTVHERIGRGGMGEVWRAEQLGPLRRTVALKVIRSGLTSTQVLARFESERLALALMNHAGIARIFAAGATVDGAPWFAMEFIDGQPITHFCDERRLDEKRRLELFLEVCRAVHHAHQRGVLHRDLKPANILVTEVEGRVQPKVIDFGLAKALDRRLEEHSLHTELGQILGTPEYMSPEQAELTEEGVDTRTDVYSLGAVLYELLAGVLPFDPQQLRRHGITELVRTICEVEAPLASARLSALGTLGDEIGAARGSTRVRLVRSLRGDLDWILAWTLAKDRERRYASVLDLVRDLEDHLAHRPVAAGPPSTVYRLRKYVRRNRVLLSVASVLVIAFVVTTLSAFASARSLKRFNTVAMERDVDELNRKAEQELWPMELEQVPAFAQWLAQAEPRAAGRQQVIDDLAAVRGAARNPDRSFVEYANDVLDRSLGRLSGELERLAANVASVRLRVEWANGLEKISITDHQRKWDEAIASIHDPAKCPLYDGLSIVPQRGLVPLAHNEFGLWEFAVLYPGAKLPEPVRGYDGKERWRIEPDTCVVLVLLPRGKFIQGAQAHHQNEPHYDDLAEELEWQMNRILLEPFFMAKYETTQGQWALVHGGENPSLFRPGYANETSEHELKNTLDLTHPVESVSWSDCQLCALRMGLSLPTEAQWEYGARSSTDSRWWTGDDEKSIEGAANICDVSRMPRAEDGSLQGGAHVPWEDGWVTHAPVGSFRPNQFGLHDTMGNVWEWVLEPVLDFDKHEARPGDGFRDHAENPMRQVRGGGCESLPANVRSSMRLPRSPAPNNGIGFRMVRPCRLP